MKSNSRRIPATGAYSIIELIISSFIFLLLLSIIYMCFFLGKTVTDYSEYSYMLTRETLISLNWIMRDLRETSLTTVRTYEDDPTDESPVLTFEAASAVGSNKLEISNFGTPLWQKYVIYTLKPDKRESKEHGIKVASLMRYELSGESNLSPFPIALELPGPKDHPTLPPGLKSSRVILRNIVLKGQDLDINGKKDDDYKGFEVTFVRRNKEGEKIGKDEFSDVNPALADDIKSNTKLVNVQMTVLEISNTTGKQNILGFSFRVNPRH